MISQRKFILALTGLAVVTRTAVVAFHIPSTVLRHDFTASAHHASSGHNDRTFHQPLYSIAVNECAILEGTSPKVVKLRKQLQAVWKDPLNTSPIILHGPRGSGKGELADEIAYHLPSWQTQNVH